jgi:hypothetical protein
VLENYALSQLNNNSNNKNNNRIFQLDGAPIHFAHIAQDCLNVNFRGRWRERGGPIAWPPRSLDLTPLGFFFGAM